MSIKFANFTYFLLFIALCGYVLPWIITPTAPLSLNAYDLAEWTSLHPSQPTASPPMIVPLLLRLQLVIIGISIALQTRSTMQRLIGLVIITLLALAQLPPLEFLTIERDNINYQQQFVLATTTLLVGGGFTIKTPKTYFAPIISVILIGIGMYTSMMGLAQAQELYTMSLQEFGRGNGFTITLLAYSGTLLLNLKQLEIITWSILLNSQAIQTKQGSI